MPGVQGMKLWRLDYQDDRSNGHIVEWFASEREADARELVVIADGVTPYNYECVDVPTTKAKLIDWLNLHLCTDNG